MKKTLSKKETIVINALVDFGLSMEPCVVNYSDLGEEVEENISKSGFKGILQSLDRKGYIYLAKDENGNSVVVFPTGEPVRHVKELKEKPKKEKKGKPGPKKTVSEDTEKDLEVTLREYWGTRHISWKTRKFAEKHMAEGEHVRRVQLTRYDRSGAVIDVITRFMMFKWSEKRELLVLAYISTKGSLIASGNERVYEGVSHDDYNRTSDDEAVWVEARKLELKELIKLKQREMNGLKSELEGYLDNC